MRASLYIFIRCGTDCVERMSRHKISGASYQQARRPCSILSFGEMLEISRCLCYDSREQKVIHSLLQPTAIRQWACINGGAADFCLHTALY